MLVLGTMRTVWQVSQNKIVIKGEESEIAEKCNAIVTGIGH